MATIKNGNGTKNADTITVTESGITVNAGAGNDTITLSKGSRNVIHGDAGKDTITVASGAGTGNTLYGDADNDTINAKASSNSVVIYGGDGADTLYGGSGEDKLLGGSGADKLFGGAGNDTLYGNEGNDTFYGNEDDDVVYGQEGNDTLYGQAGNDSLSGGAGNDYLSGGDGADTLYGGDGKDALYGGDGNDSLSGGADSDTLTGGKGTDKLSGGAGADTFAYASGDGNDTITDYTAGEDKIKLTSGSVSGTTVSGNDIKFTVDEGSILVKDGSGQTISLRDSRGSYTVSGKTITLESDFSGELDAAAYQSTVAMLDGRSASAEVTLKGNGKGNTVYGGTSGDKLYGYGGADKIYGYGGDDKLFGGVGDDKLFGGAGNDTLYGNEGADTFYGNEGNDLLYGQDGNDTLYGQEGKDTLNGGEGNDYLSGGADSDTLTGGLGTDKLSGGAGADTFAYGSGDGNDTITDYTAGEDKIKITSGLISGTTVSGNDIKFTVGEGSILVKDGSGQTISLRDSRGSYTVSGKTITLESGFSGELDAAAYLSTVAMLDGRFASAEVTLKGNAKGNTVYGGTSGDKLYGYGGADKIYGYGGDDKLFGGTGDDKLFGGTGDDTAYGNEGADTFYGNEGNDLLYGQDGNDTLYGQEDNDTLNGGEGDDYLSGGAGNDTLSGGTGNDTLKGGEGKNTLTGGAGKDTFVYANSEGNDTITDYTEGDDTLLITDTITKSMTVSATDVQFGIGAGGVILKDALNKKIHVQDIRGTYYFTDAGSKLSFNEEFYGVFDAGGFAPVVIIDSGNLKNGTIITGNTQDNIIYAAAAYGRYEGKDGNDKIYGNIGNDIIEGGSGDDELYGDGGNDDLSGDEGNDVLYGGDGDDVLRSGFGNDELYGGSGNDVLSSESGGDNTLFVGGAGDDWLFGGPGNDTFRYSQGDGFDSVCFFNNSGYDVLEISNGLINQSYRLSGSEENDLWFSIGSNGGIYLYDAAEKTINIKDSRGSYTVSASEINLNRDFTGTLDSSTFLSTVKTINARNAAGYVKITGNLQDNIIYAADTNNGIYSGGSGNDTLYGHWGGDNLYGDAGNDYLLGGLGADYLYGGSDDDELNGYTGNDHLWGGTGKDTFVYAYGEGQDVIYDYEEGEDILQINNGTSVGMISKTELTNSDKDLKFTVGSGSVTLKDAAGKIIDIKDYRGRYTISGNTIELKSDFSGEINSSNYLPTVTWIRGNNTKSGVTIRGNQKDNVIYGGSGSDVLYAVEGDNFLIGNDGNDTLYAGTGNDYLSGGTGNDKLYGGSGTSGLNGGSGNDSLYGGSGDDTFYAYGVGNDTIYNYKTAGKDVLNITGVTIEWAGLINENKDVLFSIGSGEVIVKDAATKSISITDSRGSYEASDKTIKLGSDFTGSMNADAYLGSVITIDGKNSSHAINITGNLQNNMIYANNNGGTYSGGAGNDTIYGGYGNDYIYGGTGDDNLHGNLGKDYLDGGDGDDYLWGSSNDDELRGGNGKDIFAFASGSGNDTIYDYTEGQDTLKILVGTISKTELANGSKDVVFTVGDDTVTLKDAATKKISIVNDYKSVSYTVSDKKIELGADYKGTMYADDYLSTVTTIDAGFAKQAVNVYGNAKANYIWVSSAGGSYHGGAGSDYIVGGGSSNVYLYGDAGSDFMHSEKGDDYLDGGEGNDELNGWWGNDQLYGGIGNDRLYGDDGNDTLYGGSGNDNLYGDDGDDELYGGSGDDTLYGGSGNDVFWYDSGNDIIDDYEIGTDTIRLSSASLNKGEIKGNDVLLTLSNGGTITVKNAAEQTIDFIDSSGANRSITPVTQQGVIKKFMKSLDDTDKIMSSVVSALNDAINYASGGYYQTWDALINKFVNDVRNYGGINENGSYTFLQNYCGIDLTNTDTGSITGWDAGGVQTKTAETIIWENGTINDLYAPPNTTSTINGLTFQWPSVYNNYAERQIVNCLYTWWAKEGLDLIDESYGLSFEESGTTVSDINVEFYYEDTSTLARVWHWWNNEGRTTQLSLQLNKKYSDEIDLTDVNGYAGNSSGYLDRILTHELTHAVMSANITGFMSLPKCIIEGAAELVHGIDDFRTSDLIRLAQSSNINSLVTALNDYSDAPVHDVYAGGYMLLRYFAKRVSDGSDTRILASSASSSSYSISNELSSVTSADAYSWSDNAVGVTESSNQLSIMPGDLSNAVLTFGSSGMNSIITDSSFAMTSNKQSEFLL